MGGNKCLNHKAYVKQIQAGHTTWCVKVIMVVPAGFSQWLLSCGLWLHTWQQSNLLAWNTVATVAISNTKLLQVKLSGRKSAHAVMRIEEDPLSTAQDTHMLHLPGICPSQENPNPHCLLA